MTYLYSGRLASTDDAFLIPRPDGAWGVKLLVPGYAGALIRVRRSNDNAESDINASGTGLDESSLSSFVGSNSAFIVKWYDQTGAGLDATQSTAGNQPRIVNAGTIDTAGGKTAPLWDGSNDYLTLGAGSGGNLDSALTGLTWIVDAYGVSWSGFPGLICKGNEDSSTSGSYILYASGTTLGWLVYSGSARAISAISGSSTITTSTWYQISGVWQASVEGVLYRDAVNVQTDSSSPSSIDAPAFDCLFGTGQGNAGPTVYPLNGYLRSVRLYRRHLPSYAISSIYRLSPP